MKKKILKIILNKIFSYFQPFENENKDQNDKKTEEGYETGEEEKEDNLKTMQERVKRMECSTGTLFFKIDSFLIDLESLEQCKKKRLENLIKLINKINQVKVKILKIIKNKL